MPKALDNLTGLSRRLFPLGEIRETKLNQPSKEVKALPYYNLLPNDYRELLRLRLYIQNRCLTDLDFRQDINDICRQEVATFVNLFGWVSEPRPPVGPIELPAMLFCDQADILTWYDECFGVRDVLNDKTRGIGVTWTVVFLYSHKLIYLPGCKLGCSTKDEITLDGSDANYLLGKFWYFLNKLPAWLRFDEKGKPLFKRTTSNHNIWSDALDTSLTGYPPTDQKPRSLRFTSFFNDEHAAYPRNAQAAHASVQGTTNNLMWVSTWKSSDDAFDGMMRDTSSPRLRIKSYWWNNYDRWQGAYKTVSGRLELVDKDFDWTHPDYLDYPYVLDGRTRSPWVDAEIRRAPPDTREEIMRDLYGPEGAEETDKFFRPITRQVVATTTKPPIRRGFIQSVHGKHTFTDDPDGFIQVFADVGGGRGGPFAAGCDLSGGTGATFSTFEVISLSTGEQVIDAADNRMDPTAWAEFCYRAMQWLNGEQGDGYTRISFENNSSLGTSFCEELLRLGYGFIDMNPRKSFRPKSGIEEEYYGLRNNDGGAQNLRAVQTGILDGSLIICSPDTQLEMEIFEKDKEKEDRPHYPRNEIGHGDRVQGLGVAWYLAKKNLHKKQPEPPPPGVVYPLPGLEAGSGEKEYVSWRKAWRARR